MIVYRVELSFSLLVYNDEGGYHPYKNLGPYTGRHITNQYLGYEVNLRGTNLVNAPEPEDDGLIGCCHGQYGFIDLRSVGNWFHSCWRSMRDCNYHIGVYDCPDKYVKIGGRQAVFQLDKSTPIESISFEEFVKGRMYYQKVDLPVRKEVVVDIYEDLSSKKVMAKKTSNRIIINGSDPLFS